MQHAVVRNPTTLSATQLKTALLLSERIHVGAYSEEQFWKMVCTMMGDDAPGPERAATLRDVFIYFPLDYYHEAPPDTYLLGAYASLMEDLDLLQNYPIFDFDDCLLEDEEEVEKKGHFLAPFVEVPARVGPASGTLQFAAPNFDRFSFEVIARLRHEHPEAVHAFRNKVDDALGATAADLGDEAALILKRALAEVGIAHVKQLQLEDQFWWKSTVVKLAFSMLPGFGPFQTTAEAVPEKMRLSGQRAKHEWMKLIIAIRDLKGECE